MVTLTKLLTSALALCFALAGSIDVVPAIQHTPNLVTACIAQTVLGPHNISTSFPTAMSQTTPILHVQTQLEPFPEASRQCNHDSHEMGRVITLNVAPEQKPFIFHEFILKKINLTENWLMAVSGGSAVNGTYQIPDEDPHAWTDLWELAYYGNFTCNLAKLKSNLESAAAAHHRKQYQISALRRMRLYLLATRFHGEDVRNRVMDSFLDGWVYYFPELLELVLEAEIPQEDPMRSLLKHALAFEVLDGSSDWGTWRKHQPGQYAFYEQNVNRSNFLNQAMMEYPNGTYPGWTWESRCRWHTHGSTPACHPEVDPGAKIESGLAVVNDRRNPLSYLKRW
ncbi:uncharacterized protein AB675_7658 [Cyphellophora attinorum]|uniref:BTB domain-containing protein n=1 Tax=Cyphellophora attinorum TaxID=1664694 RepID=A0A0N1P1E9_9EURO|nr:uncharacterized protein AB675_7658 [Phialophora attinorum]KPI40596.1 hypothetical protein AB675_7658 [Phialophora attinorum]